MRGREGPRPRPCARAGPAPAPPSLPPPCQALPGAPQRPRPRRLPLSAAPLPPPRGCDSAREKKTKRAKWLRNPHSFEPGATPRLRRAYTLLVPLNENRKQQQTCRARTGENSRIIFLPLSAGSRVVRSCPFSPFKLEEEEAKVARCSDVPTVAAKFQVLLRRFHVSKNAVGTDLAARACRSDNVAKPKKKRNKSLCFRLRADGSAARGT